MQSKMKTIRKFEKYVSEMIVYFLCVHPYAFSLDVLVSFMST